MCDQFEHPIDGVRLFAVHPDLHDVGLSRNNFPNGLTAESPDQGEFFDSVVFLKRGVSGGHIQRELAKPIRDVRSELADGTHNARFVDEASRLIKSGGDPVDLLSAWQSGGRDRWSKWDGLF